MTDLRSKIVKQFGNVVPENQEVSKPTEMISTNIMSFDHALGGGIPRGHITHLWGPDGAGKTTSMIPLIHSAQKIGTTVYIALEPKINPAYFIGRGVDPDKTVFVKTMSKNDVLHGNKAMDLIREVAEDCVLIVLDSVAGLTPSVVYDMDSGDIAMAKVAALLAYQLPIISNIVAATNTALVMINQQRASFEQYGMDTKPFAGYAILHWVSINAWMRSSGWIKDGGATVGFKTKVTTNKNTLAPPRRTAEWSIMFDTGIDYVEETFMFARKAGIISTGGGYIKMGNVELNHPGERGIDDALARVRAEPDLYDAIVKEIVDGN